MGQMLGDRDTKKLHIITMLKETHCLERRKIFNYNNRNMTPRNSIIDHAEFSNSTWKMPT